MAETKKVIVEDEEKTKKVRPQRKKVCAFCANQTSTTQDFVVGNGIKPQKTTIFLNNFGLDGVMETRYHRKGNKL